MQLNDDDDDGVGCDQLPAAAQGKNFKELESMIQAQIWQI